VSEPVAELTALGAVAAGSPRDLASGCDVIGVCVRDDQDVRAVCLGDGGLFAGAKPGCVVAIHSTVLPETVIQMSEAAASRGIGLLDAPITGGEAGAAQGKLTYMVGGSKAHLAAARTVFESSAERIIHTGPLGSGAAIKLCNNLMTYLGFLAAYEAMHLARASGVSQEKLEEVTTANGNLSPQGARFLALYKLPLEARSGEPMQKMLEGFTTLAEKDLALTLVLARKNGVTLPGTGLCQQLMARVYGLADPGRR
jgi:3-hydroxyisobutyrate dehydrogenase